MNTKKYSKTAKYARFGAFLAEKRLEAGIPRQEDFARRVASKQQTVSRWEAGLSRPRDKQIAQIAAVLGVDAKEVRQAAGYENDTVVVSFDQPFPFDALSPESFERISAAIVQRLYPEAAVHQLGGRGHKQDGSDITATFPDKSVLSFQCKRAEEFGPLKVRAAIGAHIRNADKCFLLLSRVASPQAREVIADNPNWEIWDRDDLSAKIRSLSRAEQVSLVDTFFPGRRLDLLGITEEGVWETVDQFFAPYENEKGLFNHRWKLIGREQSLDDLNGALKDDDKAQVIFFVGPGGSGKTRVLKHVVEDFKKLNRTATVWFLSRTAEVTKSSLEQLGEKKTLLVIDDAHERTDLAQVFQFLASNKNSRAIFAARKYGLQTLKNQASTFALTDAIRELVLAPLSKADAEKLALQVLKKDGGPNAVAKRIAELTYDCPLATVVGAQIVAREKKNFDLASNEDAFRSTLFSRFQDVIAGDIGQKSDAGLIKKVLRVLSLFQPFYIDDKALLDLISTLEDVQPHDTNRILKLLIESGILFKRGARYRLSPDVLADYVIEDACIGPKGQSTGYAEKAFQAAQGQQIELVLLNLGKLDWRLSNGDASNSKLLADIWAELKPANQYGDPYIRAVQEVAYYLPLQAIEFGERLIRSGQFLDQLPPIFHHAAYNYQYLKRACAALWQLGRDDERGLGQTPSHAVRILAELCEFQPSKPVGYNDAIVDFAIALARDPAEWDHHHTPLDILTSAFKTEGHTTVSKNAALVFNPFLVTPKIVRKIRDKVFALVLDLLSDGDIRVATAAASALASALRYPMGLFNIQIDDKLREEWGRIFCEELQEIEKAVKSRKLDALVLVGIAKSVSWHALYAGEPTETYANRVRAALSNSLEYRTIATLVDGYGQEFRRLDRDDAEELWRKHLDALAKDLFAAYPDGEKLRAYIGKHLSHIQKGGKDAQASPYALFTTLLQQSPSLVRATIIDALDNPGSPTEIFVAEALLNLWKENAAEARDFVAQFMKTNRPLLLRSIGGAIAWVDWSKVEYSAVEADTVSALVQSDVDEVIHSGISAIRSIARFDRNEALRLGKLVHTNHSNSVADALLALFAFDGNGLVDAWGESDLEWMLDKIADIPEHDGYWIQTLLSLASERFPERVLKFFMDRVERSVASGKWDMRPVNHGPYVHVPLKFNSSGKYAQLLPQVVAWMARAKPSVRGPGSVIFDHQARELFDAVFGTFDDDVIQFISRWCESADEQAFDLIANVLREADHTFVYNNVELVTKLLSYARKVSKGAYDAVVSALYASGMGGMRSGIAGQPFQRDVDAKLACEKILAGMSSFSPAFEVYDVLRKEAERQIERAHQDGESFED